MIKNAKGVLEREANNDLRLVKPITAMATFINRANRAQAELFSSKKYLCVFKAGRGIGKSLLLSYTLAEFLITTRRRNAVLIAPTITDAHTTLIDSEASGLAFFFDIHNKHLFKYDRQYNYIVYLPTMSKVFIFGATGEDKVRDEMPT